MSPAAVRPVQPVYNVAGLSIAGDRPIAALEALRSDRAPDLLVHWGPVTLPSQASEVFDGTARVGARCCRVRGLAAPDGDFLEISGAGAFAVRRGEIAVDPEPGAGETAVEEALLGPALALAFARRGVFVLHASAVVVGGGVIGFLGDSGAGKSTLARLLVEDGKRVTLAADDLLAVGPEPAALPHYPQLKLDPASMASIADLAPGYPLLALCALEPAPPDAAVGGEALPPGSAAALLLRHTIAGRLFAADLLAAHLAFAAGIAGRVPVRRLTVPRRLDVGAEVLEHLLK